jgi:[calcium/calmodulin-dependent protein kinase] kinase
MELGEKIQTEPVSLPSNIDPLLRDLIEKLLEKDPSKRITISGLKNHPWVTKNGTVPMKADPMEVWVDEREISSAIKTTTGSIASVVVRCTMMSNWDYIGDEVAKTHIQCLVCVCLCHISPIYSK